MGYIHSALRWWDVLRICKYRDMQSTWNAGEYRLLCSAKFNVDITKVTQPLSETAETSSGIKLPNLSFFLKLGIEIALISGHFP